MAVLAEYQILPDKGRAFTFASVRASNNVLHLARTGQAGTDSL
jgi:hypothetical protein